MRRSVAITDESIIEKIYLIRAQKVMLDTHLAALYVVTTKAFNQAVKRNLRRFPADFMFRLNAEEAESLRSQIVTSSRGGRRYYPYVFTEQGVAMLSSILRSETAIEVDIRIIRVFTQMRKVMLSHKDILLKLGQMEKQLMIHGQQLTIHEKEIQIIFSHLKKLLESPAVSRKRIGFRTEKNDD